MSPRRPALVVVAAAAVVAFCLPLAAQTDDPPPLSPRERNDLEREIRVKERHLHDFEAAVRKLQGAARQTNQTPARQAADEVEQVMRDVLRYEQEKLGDDLVLKQQGEDVPVVHTDELTDSRSVRTKNRRRATLPADLPPEYVRLVRLQEIYSSLQRSREHAIAREADAVTRYGNLTREFAELLRLDLAALQARLPEREDPGLFYPLRTDSTQAAPDDG